MDAAESVNTDAIPFLKGPYEVHGVEKYGLIGDAPKNYIVFPDRAFIAKKPRKEGPIECVTEYLIARIGRQLPLRVAEGGLVRLPTPAGSPPDVRFLSRQFLNLADGDQLVHGAQLVATCFDIDQDGLFKEVDRGNEPEFFTVTLVADVLSSIATSVAEADALRAGFARMIAFDALVGANDRHAQNWGVVQNAAHEGRARVFSPIFDTARGLFWNHDESQLEAMDQKGRAAQVARYANRSAPLVGIDTAKKPNHFDVIAYMVARPHFCTPVRQVIRAFEPDAVARLLHHEFKRLLSRRRLEYIDALLRFRHATLSRLAV